MSLFLIDSILYSLVPISKLLIPKIYLWILWTVHKAILDDGINRLLHVEQLVATLYQRAQILFSSSNGINGSLVQIQTYSLETDPGAETLSTLVESHQNDSG